MSTKHPTLPEYQKLISRLVIERGFAEENVADVFMIMTEEVGELGKAIRKARGLKVHKDSRLHGVEEEAADVFWLLLDLCNRLEIDLEKAFAAKEKKNKKRQWS